MRSASLLLLAICAFSAAAFVNGAVNPLSWDAATQKKALQVLRQAGLLPAGANVGAMDDPNKTFAGKYLVMFEAGMGCALWSTYEGPNGNCVGRYCPAAVVAFGKAMPSNKASKGFWQCRFTASDVVPTQPGQELLIKYSGYDPALFKLADPAAIAPADTLCAFNVFSPTLQNRTTVIPAEDGTETIVDATIGGLALVWSEPMLAGPNKNQGSLNVYCKANYSIADSSEQLAQHTLAQLPFDACFPAHAQVKTPAGPKAISELRVGDLVQSGVDASGAPVFDSVYLTPHRDANSFSSFLNLHLEAASGASRVLTLSPRHYVATACGPHQAQRCLKHASQVQEGDMLWMEAQGQAEAAMLGTVTQVTSSLEQGLFSPWTLSGSIVVDGVLASTHTAWPGEAALLALLPEKAHAARAAHLFAAFHQAVQSPLRLMYSLMGPAPLQLIDAIVFRVVDAHSKPGQSSMSAAAFGSGMSLIGSNAVIAA